MGAAGKSAHRGAFRRGEDFQRIEREVLDILNKDTQIPWVSKRGEYYYNFWQDQANPRGLLRRTTLDEYRKAKPARETVLDIDALGKAEGKDWVYQGSQPLAPEYRYCLMQLSPDGGDATEIREFDLVAKRFVKDGFNVPVAKVGSLGRSGHAVHRHRFRPRIDDPVRLRAHRQTLAARHAAERRRNAVRSAARGHGGLRLSRSHAGL